MDEGRPLKAINFLQRSGQRCNLEWLSPRTLPGLCKPVSCAGCTVARRKALQHMSASHSISVGCTTRSMGVPGPPTPPRVISLRWSVRNTWWLQCDNHLSAISLIMAFPQLVFFFFNFYFWDVLFFLCRLHAPWAGATFSIWSCLMLLPNEHWKIIKKWIGCTQLGFIYRDWQCHTSVFQTCVLQR